MKPKINQKYRLRHTDMKWDVIYRENDVNIEPHFCRDDGCYGTNLTHGFTFDEAKQHLIDFHETVIEELLTKTERDYLSE